MVKLFSRGPAACGRCASQKSFLKALALLVLMLVVNVGVLSAQIYTVTVQANNPAYGSVSGGEGGLVIGELIELTATPNQGYVFVRWDDGNTDNPRDYEVTGDATITAIFATLSYLSPVYKTGGVTAGIDHWDTLSCTEFTVVDPLETDWGTSGQDSWYVVNANTTISSTVTCEGNVHLILMNGNTLNTNGIQVNSSGNATLTIYAQDTASSVMGVLNATNTGSSQSGIGSDSGETNGDITINGGKITASGGANSAGIGGGEDGSSSNITINGGIVNATGNTNAAGIGGGANGDGQYITINGGNVTATGGNNGAGIGGGNGFNCNDIRINGGKVTANGGQSTAGIGSGNSGSPAANIYVAGNMTLKAGSSANPTTEISHTSTQDVALDLEGKQYATAVEQAPVTPVSYLSPVYNTTGTPTSGINHWDTLSCTTYTAVTSSTTTWGTSSQDKWYVLNASTTISSDVTCYGNVHLILMNNCTLNVNRIQVEDGYATLTIYAQDTANSLMGVLNATNPDEYMQDAGIGGPVNEGNGAITINGGKITANGAEDGGGAGIGGGYEGLGSYITINGGYVTANGTAGGAGIGGGNDASGSNITINGGNVTANGSEGGAGIGGGDNGSGSYITINGGYVSATGNSGGAGIGGGNGGSASNITINGGNVTANGGDYADGIGAGVGNSSTSLNIFVADNILLKADTTTNPPTTVIAHASITSDVASLLHFRRYATAVEQAPGPDTLNYLHFVSLKGGDTVKLTKDGLVPDVNLEYSTNNRQTWTNYTINNDIALTQGDTVWFRAGGTTHKNATFSTQTKKYYQFVFGTNDSIAAGGNIMSLYDATLQQDTMTQYGFCCLFLNCKALVSAPELPAQTLAEGCYIGMFGQCTSLTSAPALPAQTLVKACYQIMFYGCTSLNVDTLGTSCDGTEMSFPATGANLWNNMMFYNCHGAYANNIKLGGHYCISEYVAPTLFKYTLSQNVDELYSGMAKSVSVTVTTPATGVTVQYSTDKGTTWTDGASVSRTNAGVDSVIFKLSAAGYTDTITDTVVLNVTKRAVTMTSASDVKTYDGQALTNSNVAVSGDLFIEGEGATYNVTGSQTVVGSSDNTFTYTLNSFTLADNYDIETTYGTLTVNANSLSNCSIEPVLNQTYTGDSITPALTVTYGSLTLTAGTDYTVEYTNNVNAGEATVTATGIGNFTDSEALNFTIDPASISDATIAEIPETTYTGSEIKPALTITFNGDTLVENTDYTVEYSDNVNVGTATATATGIGNFTGTASKNFTIVPKAFEYTLSQNVDETYSGMAKSVSVTVTDPATGATVKYSTDKGDTWTDGASVSRTNAGTDSVIFKLSAVGHTDTITDTVVLNVSKRYITMTSSSDEKTFDGQALTNSNVEVSGDLFIEGEGATYNVTGTQTAAGSSDNTFTYTLNGFTLAENYDIDTIYGTLTVNAADITNATIADIPAQTHTGDSIKPGLNITLGSYDLVAGTDYTVSYINNVEIGTATANVTGVGNFTGTASKEFTIVPDTFDITVNVNDAAMGNATGTGRYVENTLATLTATANEHYHFTGWDNGRTENPYTVYVEKDSTITAQFALDSFKLNVVAGEPDWGTVTGAGEYEYGAVRTITATAADHFHFVNWSNGVTDTNTTVTLTSDSTIVAIFAMDRNTVTLTVNNPALGTVEGAGEYDYYDNTITLIAVPANNHVRFDGWYSSNQFAFASDTLYHIQIGWDINLEARFSLDEHAVTVTAGEGGSVTGGNTYTHGATATLVATPLEHYHFVNWSNGSVNDTLRFTVDTTYSFTANFAIDEHVVRTNVNNTAAGSVTGAGTYNYGDTATLTATANAHYEFVNWSNGLTDTTINVVLAGDTTLTAIFARDTHVISVVNNNPGMGTVSGGNTYSHGDMATISATANDHYHFTGWSSGEANTSYSIQVTDNYADTANFAIDRHNVTVLRNNNAYGTVTGAGEYDYGASVPLTATANQYYHFTGWSNGVQTATMTITLAGDTTVTANFAVDTFDIVASANVDSMGTITGAGRYTYGQMVTLTATPAADHHFVNWSNGETRNSFSFMPDSNVTITAIFAINEQQVTVSSIDDALGTVAGSGTYNWGTMVTVTATNADHYHFTGWSDGSMANPYRFKLTNDTMLVASFAIDTFTVTVAANYDSLGTVTGAGRYTYGTAVTLTATPVAHYHVAGWSNGMTGETINVVVTSDSDLVAYFEIDTFFVTGNVIGVGQIENLGVYNDGDTVTLIATQTDDNYIFAGWTGDTTGIEMLTDLSTDIIMFVITRDVEFTATFVYVPTSVDETESVEYVAFSEGMNVVVNGVEDRMVAVYDMTGKLVKIVKSAQDVERISVHAAGIYLVRVDNKTTLRVVVK